MLKQSSRLFTSKGADNIYENGSKFQVMLINDRFVIPADGKIPTIELHHARVWWTIPNLNATTFKFTVNATNYETGPIPKGLYDLDLLASAIKTGLGNLEMPTGLYTFSGNSANQTVNITFNQAGLSIDFTDSPIAYLMGFDSGVYPNIPSFSGQTITAQNVARFNQVSSFLIHMSGLNRGIPMNNSSSGILAEILIDKAAGSQLVFTPQNPIRIPCPELLGNGQNLLTFWLTDQDNRPVDTLGEFWSFVATLSWY